MLALLDWVVAVVVVVVVVVVCCPDVPPELRWEVLGSWKLGKN